MLRKQAHPLGGERGARRGPTLVSGEEVALYFYVQLNYKIIISYMKQLRGSVLLIGRLKHVKKYWIVHIEYTTFYLKIRPILLYIVLDVTWCYWKCVLLLEIGHFTVEGLNWGLDFSSVKLFPGYPYMVRPKIRLQNFLFNLTLDFDRATETCN